MKIRARVGGSRKTMRVWVRQDRGGLRAQVAAAAVLVAFLVPQTAARASLYPRYAGVVAERPSATTIDLIWGNGSKGPYALSQRPIVPGSVSVRLNGARELLPSEYQVDAVAGTITFGTALLGEHVARVEYVSNPAGGNGQMSLPRGPLSLDLAQVRLGAGIQSIVSVKGAFQITDASQTPIKALGVGLDTTLGSGTRVTSVVALSPRAAGDRTNGDTTGVHIAAESNSARGKARASYLRTGEAFAGAKDFQWQQGVERLDLSGTFALTRQLTAQSDYRRIEEALSGSGATRTTTLLASALTAEITPYSRLTLQRHQEQIDSPAEAERTRVTDRIQLDQRFGKSSSAQVHHEVTVAGTGGETQTTETTGVQLDARLTDSTRVVARRVETRAEDQDAAVQTQVAVTAGLSGGRVRLEGEFSEQERAGLVTEGVQGARVEATPVQGVRIGGGLQQTQVGGETTLQKHAAVEVQAPAGIRVAGTIKEQTDGDGTTVGLVRAVDATIRPVQGVEMSGTVKEREARDQAGTTTRGLHLHLAPARYFQFTGGFIHNPEEQGRVVQERRRTVGLRSDLGRLTFTGDLAQRFDVSARPLAEELQVGLAVNLSETDRLFTSYKVAETTGAASFVTTHFALGYSRRVSNTLLLSFESELLGRTTESRRERDEVRARASLNLRF